MKEWHEQNVFKKWDKCSIKFQASPVPKNRHVQAVSWLRTLRAERRGEMNWEIGIDVYAYH